MSQEIQQLVDGNKIFRKKYFGGDSTLFDELVLHGQRPKVMVVACSDSRVDPAMIFNCQPGQLFVVRNIASLIPPYESNNTYHGTSAALEFGICFLDVEHIIVFGHTECGGIRALLENGSENIKKENFIGKWMEIAKPAYTKIMEEHRHEPLQVQITFCGQYALINSLENLKSFPWIKDRMMNGKLALHAWYFDLVSGGICQYNQLTGHWLFE